MSGPYRLSCELQGHSKDVRGVAELSGSAIVSASRDNTAIVWRAAEDAVQGSPMQACARFEEHSNFVNAVACLPPTDAFPAGLVVTGSLDRTAVVWDPLTAEPLTHLIGHDNAV